MAICGNYTHTVVETATVYCVKNGTETKVRRQAGFRVGGLYNSRAECEGHENDFSGNKDYDTSETCD